MKSFSVYGDQAAWRRKSLVVALFTGKLIKKSYDGQSNQERSDYGRHKHGENLSV
jgi:hypothetical protein